MIVHGIVRLPFQTICCVFEPVAARFPTFLISEHEADDEVKTTHCHFLVDISVHFGNLDSFRKYLKGLPDFYMYLPNKQDMELHTKTFKEKVSYDVDKLAIYIIKRTCLPKQYGSHFTSQKIAEYSSLWVGKAATVKSPLTDVNKDSLNEMAKKHKATQWQLLQEMMDEPHEAFGQIPDKDPGYFYTFSDEKVKKVHPSILKQIVIKVMVRYRQIPHPIQVDKFIGSMFNLCNNDNYNDYDHISYSRYLK